MTHETPQTDPTPTPETDEAAPSAEFAQALAAHEASAPAAPAATAAAASPAVGAKVHARVVSIQDDTVLFDVGGRSEATGDARAFRNDDGSSKITVGEELDLYVLAAGDSLVLGATIARRREGREGRKEPKADLGPMREAAKSGVPVSGRVTAVNSGGLAVDVAGVRGFCPLSQIELGFCADASVYVGRTLEFIVSKVEESRHSVVLSRRALLKKTEGEQAKQRLAALKPGDELDGTVRRLEPFGAFVDLGGIDGLVHVSEIRHERLGHPKDALKEGERVRVRVLRLEEGKDGKPRIALSIKATTPDPWGGVAGQFSVGQRLTGTVARLADFGAFVNVAPGIDGLVHVSAVTPERIEHVRDALTVGQSVEVIVLAVEPEKKRISLSIKDALPGAVPSAPRAPRPAGEPGRERRPGGDSRGGEARGGETRGGEARGGETRGGESRGGEGRGGGARSGGPRGAGGGRDRGPGGGGGAREGGRGGRDGAREGGRGGREERAPAFYSTPGPVGETTMAIALRKAMEAAKAKEQGKA